MQKYVKYEVKKVNFKGNGLLPDFLQQVRIISPFCQEMAKLGKMDWTIGACGGCCCNTLQTKVLLMETPVPSPSFRIKKTISHVIPMCKACALCACFKNVQIVSAKHAGSSRIEGRAHQCWRSWKLDDHHVIC